MAKPRIDITDIPYHIFARGNNKQPIFIDEVDRLVFLKYWRKAKEAFDVRIFTYALMDNHFHFLLQMEKESSLISVMHDVLFEYARYFNRKYNRVGHLFQSRYNSILVESDSYFLTVDRYIALNPVRAGMVARPEDHPWSSYRSRFHNIQNDWIDHDMALSYFKGDRDSQRNHYRKFIQEGIQKPEEWSLNDLQKLRFLGSSEFIQKITAKKQILA